MTPTKERRVEQVNFNLKSLKVGGKMSTKQADRVGNKLANAAVIIAVAVLLWVVRWW